MAIRTTRDWRGIKHQLSEYSSEDLMNLLVNAYHTYDEVAHFIDSIDAELVLRDEMVEACVA